MHAYITYTILKTPELPKIDLSIAENFEYIIRELHLVQIERKTNCINSFQLYRKVIKSCISVSDSSLKYIYIMYLIYIYHLHNEMHASHLDVFAA